MNSRDLVLKTLAFGGPERIPFASGPTPDIAYVDYAPARGFNPTREGMDEWGCVWQSLNISGGDQGQVVEHPLADWRRFDRYEFPDPFVPGRFERLPVAVAQCRQAGLFVTARLRKGPMHLLDQLRGFENYLADLVSEPERIELLLDGIFAFLRGLTRRFAESQVDAVILTDDQAIQTGPLFSMELWRRHFKPRYAALFGLAHALGLKVWLHACGDLSEMLVDLREAGVDIIDNKQPALWMDSPAVDKVRGKMSFSTCVDIQTTIFSVPIEGIGAEVERLVKRLSAPAGGFLVNYYSNPDLKIPPAKIERMLEAFRYFRWA